MQKILRNRWNERRLLIFGLLGLVAAYAYNLGLILDPQTAWVLPEAFFYKTHIMQNVPLEPWSIFKETFNNHIFEWSDRITRPLSSTFEILDTHFRAYLWTFMRPMPSLSITYLFSLVLTPLLLIGTLRRMGIRPWIALVGTAVFMLQPGTLSLVVMLFRPAKAMMNFWMVLTLFLAADKPEKVDRPIHLVAIGLTTVMGFLFDETAVAIAVAVALMFPHVYFKSRRRVAGFAIVPIGLLIAYLKVFPYIAKQLGYGKVNLLAYTSWLAPMMPKTKILIHTMLMNIWVVVRESLGLFAPWQTTGWALTLATIVSMATLLVLIVTLVRRWRGHRNIIDGPLDKNLSWMLRRTLIVFFSLTLFHGLLMNLTGLHETGRVWGLYWYGTYFGVFFGMICALVGELLCRGTTVVSRPFLAAMVAMTVVHVLAFPYLNYQYRKAHFSPYEPVTLERMFRGKTNRFVGYDPSRFSSGQDIEDLWRAAMRHEPLTTVKKDIYYVAIETGAVRGNPQPSLWNLMSDVSEQTEFHLPLKPCAQEDCIR